MNSDSSLGLISKFLDQEKVKEIVVELSNTVLKKENENFQQLHVFCQLLDQVDDETISTIYPKILDYCNEIVDNCHYQDRFESLVLLASKLPQLFGDFTNRVLNYIKHFSNSAIHRFLPDIKVLITNDKTIKLNETETIGKSVDFEFMLYLLELLSFVFAKCSDDIQFDVNLDLMLSYLLGIDIEEISTLVSQLLKWRIESLTKNCYNTDFVWNIIFSLENSDNNSHKTDAYILWLRYLNNSENNLKNDSYFQDNIITKLKYWKLLQQGLISSLHEHRKICLSVLKVSILNINTVISNEIFHWELKDSANYIDEWTRFLTVYELLAIDTSLHQAEGAIGDIVGLISPTSPIHSSWGLSLLSTGFRAGTESVRKFTLNLLLSIPKESIYLMKHALPILEEIFLPYMMQAGHFVVIDESCPYGEILVDFVSTMISTSKSDQDIQEVAASVSRVLKSSKHSYDPSSIFVARGLLDGLKGREVLQYGIHDTLILDIIESQCEGVLYQIASKTIYLDLIFNFKLTSIEQLSNFLDKFIKFNGSQLVVQRRLKFQQYLVKNNTNINELEAIFEDTSVSYGLRSVVYFLISCQDRTKINSMYAKMDNILFATIMGSNFSDDIDGQNLDFSRFGQFNPQSQEDYEFFQELSKCQDLPMTLCKQIDLSLLWKSIQSDILLPSEETLRGSVYKYSVFNKVFEKCETPDILTLDSILKFKDDIFVNVKTADIQSKDFYKVKEDILGQFFKTTELLLHGKKLTIDQVRRIVTVLTPDLSNYQSNLSITSIIRMSINQLESNDDIMLDLLKLLSDLWFNLVSSRLQLYQKDLHLRIIETMFLARLMQLAADNEELSSLLLEFSLSVTDNASGRRSLLPALTKCISSFQISNEPYFGRSKWLAETLVRAYMVYQLRTNSFKLEQVIGEIYDSKLSMFEESIYQIVYGINEISAQVNLMAIFNSIKSPVIAQDIFDFILDNEQEFNLFKVIKRTDGYEEWTRVRLFAIICSLSCVIDNKAFVNNHLSTFIGLLETDPSPLARAYLEWITSYHLVGHVSKTNEILQRLQNLLGLKDIKPTLVCAYQRLLFLNIQQFSEENEELFLTRLLGSVIPGATSNKATIRHFSLSLTCSIYEEIDKKKLNIPKDLFAIVNDIYQSAVSSGTYGEFRSGDALLWDIKKDFTLVCLSGGILLRVSDHEIEYISKEQFLHYLSKEQTDFLNIPIGDNCKELWVKERKLLTKKSTITTRSLNVEQSPLQTKSGAWNSVMDIDDTSRGSEIVRSNLIVVSSLVDKPPNLGGICRLSDVLGAGLLTVDDISVKDHPQFKNVAVTADQWMPIEEVKINNLIPFLREKKKDGYTLMGLEQTDKSVQLNKDLKFPEKSLILLGKEREGIPGELLAELDTCIEIKQVGVIRSMNIQTATAIIVHAYSSQHC